MLHNVYVAPSSKAQRTEKNSEKFLFDNTLIKAYKAASCITSITGENDF